MEKSAGIVLMIVGFVLLALLVGFFIGRNSTYSPVLTSKLPATTQAGEKININTATVQQLQELPGIGQSLAERIVAYRNVHGSFQLLEDLTLVEGIGIDTLAKLLDKITL